MSPSNRNEEAIFSIVTDSSTLLFEAGTKISGYVFIHFHGTNEIIDFKSLCIYLKENVNLPQGAELSRNLTSHVYEKQILLTQSSELYSQIILDLNQSNIAKISFDINLPKELCATFNSKQISVTHEIKAELKELQLCGELCKLSASQPIEIREILGLDDVGVEMTEMDIGIANLETWKPNEIKNEKYYESEYGTLQVALNKRVYNFGDILSAELSFQSKVTLSKGILCLHLVQVIELRNEFASSRWENIIYKTRQVVFMHETGLLTSRKSIPLIDPTVLSQPTVKQNHFFKVKYIFRVFLEFRKREILVDLDFHIERRKSYLCDSKRIFSTNSIPLLPLNLTVSDLKADGLQSYIPLKSSYENKRLQVKKGDLRNPNALLTVVTNSCHPYYNDDVIKGYVFFQLDSSTCKAAVEFQNVYMILVGMRRYPGINDDVNGEIFLYKRLTLRGSRNQCGRHVKLLNNFSFMINEFEFDLKRLGISLPPTFESSDYRISYELKVDMFKLKVNATLCSLYTTLPVVIMERPPLLSRDISSSVSRTSAYERYVLSGNEVTVWYTIDKPCYHHQDIIQVHVNIKNKSKHQLIVKLELNQYVESSHFSRDVKKFSVYNSIVILILPKSRLQTVENIFLKDILFHKQPSIENYKLFKVSYALSSQTSVQSSQKILGEVSLPLRIVRKYGHLNKRISLEGYPLLPVNLEIYGGVDKESFILPDFLMLYSDLKLLNVISSKSVTSEWSHWRFDNNAFHDDKMKN